MFQRKLYHYLQGKILYSIQNKCSNNCFITTMHPFYRHICTDVGSSDHKNDIKNDKIHLDDSTKYKKRLDIDRISFIGGGNMADAIINGLLAKQLVPKKKLLVSDPDPVCRERYSLNKIPVIDQNRHAVKDAQVIVLAVKPQILPKVMEDIEAHLMKDTLVISIVAGATIEEIRAGLGEDISIVRSMPNTPAMIGEAITVWSQSESVTEEQHNITKTIIGCFGDEVFVSDETNLDMATALSGTGPAYFYLVAEAMIDTGVHMGFPRSVATRLVKQTMVGSSLYMKKSKLHPVELRNNITSPGGTTAAALYRAEKNGFRAVIADSIWAAYERCRELGSSVPIIRKRPRS